MAKKEVRDGAEKSCCGEVVVKSFSKESHLEPFIVLREGK